MDKTDTSNNIKSGVIICGGRHFNDYDTLETTIAVKAVFNLDNGLLRLLYCH